jgi:hypothetical protein
LFDSAFPPGLTLFPGLTLLLQQTFELFRQPFTFILKDACAQGLALLTAGR